MSVTQYGVKTNLIVNKLKTMKETTQNQEAHIFAYLPYKLKCTRIKWDNKFVKDFGIKELIGLLYNTNRECFVGIF